MLSFLGAALAGPSRVARRIRGVIGPPLRDYPGGAWAMLAGLYLLLVLWGPVPALRNWLGVLVLGALVAIGFEAFRRLTLAELENGGPAMQATTTCHAGRLRRSSNRRTPSRMPTTRVRHRDGRDRRRQLPSAERDLLQHEPEHAGDRQRIRLPVREELVDAG